MIMDSNFSTFAKISQESAFEGQWVVILDEKIVARGTARKIKEEMKSIRKNHPKEMPLIAKVPKKVMQIV